MKWVTTIFQMLLAIVAVIITLLCILIIWTQGRGIGQAAWYIPISLLTLAFFALIGGLLVAKSEDVIDLTLTDSLQAISAIFSTIFVILGLFFVVSEFGRAKLDRNAEIAELTTKISNDIYSVQDDLYDLRREILASNQEQDLALIYKPQMAAARVEIREVAQSARHCARFRTCDATTIRERLCDLGEAFGYFDIDIFYPTSVSNIDGFTRLHDDSYDLLVRNCSIAEVIYIGASDLFFSPSTANEIIDRPDSDDAE